MVLLFHIIAAVSGIGLSSAALLAPSQLKIRLSYYAVALTIASGTYITVARHLSLTSVCLSGLLYVGFTLSALIAASHRLSRQKAKSE